MKERWTVLTANFCGSVVNAGTAVIVAPVPLSLQYVTMCTSADDGTVVIWKQGGTPVATSAGVQGTGAVALGPYAAGIGTVTAYSGTTLFGAGTVSLVVPASGTIRMSVSSGTAVKAFVTSWWTTGE